MPTLFPTPVAQNIHETNARLRSLLDTLDTGAGPAQAPLPATPQQMAGLLSELMRVGEWLRILPEDRDTDLEEELSEYRKNVECLRALLPSMHAALLRERARLEQERARVEGAAEWARRSRQTL
ncbi:MAG TPA: hypothetical protein VGM18_02625 [Candidatus Sulfotelmatobacter sp.]